MIPSPSARNRRDLPESGAIKALALDLDGTALRPGAILSDRTAQALRSCIRRGITVILCTGRPLESANRYRERIGAEGPLVCYNGAEVVDMPSGAILGASLLKPQIADYCADLARRMGLYYQAFFPQDLSEGFKEALIANREGPEAEQYRNHSGIEVRIADLKAALAAPGLRGCIKTMFQAERDAQDRIRSLLEARFGGEIYITRSHADYLEIMAAGVSKGAGLKLALEHTGLAPSQVIAFGDEENDLPVFAEAGFAAAPANAQDKIRAAADLVIGSNTEDGAAEFLENFFK